MNNHLTSNSKLLDLDIAKLSRLSFEHLQTQRVEELVIALGSNDQAQQRLAMVHKGIRQLGKMQLSTAFENADFTATSDQQKPNYTNQCVYLLLNHSIALSQLQTIFKGFEKECGRLRELESKQIIESVAMDIDILMVKAAKAKNSLSANFKKEWTVIAERYPFKDHERVGIMELLLK